MKLNRFLSQLPRIRLTRTSRQLSLLVLLVLVFLCGVSITDGAQLRRLTSKDRKVVDDIVKQMTSEEKVGQMFMVGFAGEEITQQIRVLIEKYHIGNVILFERNIKGMRPYNRPALPALDDLSIPYNVATLTNTLQDTVRSLNNDPRMRIPLLVAVDQENGSQIRIEKGVTILPGSIAIGQTRSERMAQQAGSITASELRAMGITMNLAPVMDVNTNDQNDIIGDRAFGGDPDIVSSLGVAFMKGLHEGGVAAVGKHFPGHGDSKDDPHKTLPVVRYDLSHLEKINLPPFQALINNGASAIMPAHMEFTALSKQRGLPASLDENMLDKILRQRCKFDGVIIGDDLTKMRAITDSRDIGTAIQMSIKAGTDIVMLAHFPDVMNLKDFGDIFKGLLGEYKKSPERIDVSVRRILLLKMRVNQELDAGKWKVNPDSIKQTVRTAEHLKQAQEIANASMVLVSEGGRVASRLEDTKYFSGQNYPFKDFDPAKTILVVSPVFAPPDALAEKFMERHGHNIRSIRLYYGWYAKDAQKTAAKLWKEPYKAETKERIEAIVKSAKGVSAVVFGVVMREHVRILEAVAEKLDIPLYVVALREPYYIPKSVLERKNVIALSAGSNVATSLEAVVKVLYGDLKPKPSSYVSVSIEDWIDKESFVGVKGDKSKRTADSANAGTWLILLGAYASGLIGAVAYVLLLPPLPGGLLVVKGQDGSVRAGFIPIMLARATFGLAAYIFVSMILRFVAPGGGDKFEVLANIPSDSWMVYTVCGFVGGFLGKSLLDIIPILKRVSKDA